MRRKLSIFAPVLLVLFLLAGPAFAFKIIDMSQKWENGMPTWGGGPWKGMMIWGGGPGQMETYDKVGGFYGHDLAFNEHTGTHMDSPAHNANGLWRLDQVPMSQFHGKCLIMDMRPWVKDRDAYEVTLEDVKAWEAKNGCNIGREAARSLIFMWTGWDKYWDEFIAGKSQRFVKYGFPGIDENAAKYFADSRIKGFGMDVLSIDIYKKVMDGNPTAHKAILGNNMLVIENLRFDPSVADKWVYAVTAPMKIYKASGAPVRVFVLDDTAAKNMAASSTSMGKLEKKFNAAPMYDLANFVENGMHIWTGVFGAAALGLGDVGNAADFRGVYPNMTYAKDGWYGQQLFINEHTGTHTDAPAHRREGAKWTLDKIALKNFAAPCVIVNASRYGAEKGDWIFDMAMFKDWMDKNPELSVKKGDIVCFSQDMVHKWALHNHELNRDWVTYTFPGIGGDVAQYLKEKGVVGALTDVTSIDAGMTALRGKGTDVTNNPTHVTLLGSGIFITENVGGQLQLAANSKGFAFVMPCMNTKAGSGGHSRVWYFEGLSIPIE